MRTRSKSWRWPSTRLPDDHPDRALVLATLCSELAYGSTLERRQALAEAALDLADSSGDDATIVWVQNHIFDPLMVPSLLEQRRTLSADALARAERIGDPLLLSWAAEYACLAATSGGDIDEADRCLEIVGSLADQLDQPDLHWNVTYLRAARAMIAGDTDHAEQLATEALQIGTDSGQPDATIMFGAQLFCVSHQRGTLGELIPLIEQTVADNPGHPRMEARHSPWPTRRLVAPTTRVVCWRSSRSPSSTFRWTTPGSPGWSSTPRQRSNAGTRSTPSRCSTGWRRGPISGAPAVSTSQGPVSHYLGGLATVLGRYDEADAYYARAAALSDRMGAKFYAASTDLSWGKLLAERQAPGDTDKAQELLTKAHSAAATHGYANVERRAAEALQHLD